MHLDDLYPSKWLNADSLNGDLDVTVRELVMHVFRDDDEPSPILFFQEVEQGLPLNVTNAKTIGELHGPETEQWPDKRVTLFKTEVDFGGKTVWGIRVRKTVPTASKPESSPADSDIPF